MNSGLKSFWRKFFDFNWKFGLLLILIICIPRFILVLNANASGNYAPIGIIMTISAIVPFIFLNNYGRKEIGITGTRHYKWLFIAFVFGCTASLCLHLAGQILYSSSTKNWYAYIGKSYKIPANISQNDKTILFVVMAFTGMTISPIGEELFFRGIVHAAFAKSIGEIKASIVDSTAFAFTHISHFGLVFIDNKWDFYFIPTVIWVTGMFLVSLLFFYFKKRCASILGAILCHSAFNFGMIICIFYFL